MKNAFRGKLEVKFMDEEHIVISNKMIWYNYLGILLLPALLFFMGVFMQLFFMRVGSVFAFFIFYIFGLLFNYIDYVLSIKTISKIEGLRKTK